MADSARLAFHSSVGAELTHDDVDAGAAAAMTRELIAVVGLRADPVS